LNNWIAQDHRNIKSRVNAMLGFKRFSDAATTMSGVELMHRVREGQSNLARLRLKDTTAPQIGRRLFQHHDAMVNTPSVARARNLHHNQLD
jgi:hypothetical protein